MSASDAVIQLSRIGIIPILPLLFTVAILCRITSSSLSFTTTGYEPKPTSKRRTFFFKLTNMTRSKPNKTHKSPHKQQIEEKNKQNKIDTTPGLTPHTTKTSKRKTGTEEGLEKRDITKRKYI
jgi:hypothetical protein